MTDYSTAMTFIIAFSYVVLLGASYNYQAKAKKYEKMLKSLAYDSLINPEIRKQILQELNGH